MTTRRRSRGEAEPAILHLRKDESFLALSSRLELLQRTQKILDENWPGMGLIVQAVRHESLLLLTPNAAVAAKCRQIEPSVITRLKPLFPGLMQVRFRPRTPERQVRAPLRSHKQPIGSQTLDTMGELLETMPAGDVRDALARLIAHRRG